MELNVSRNRKEKFEHIIVTKKQSRIDSLDKKVISLDVKGMSNQVLRFSK
ncbi:MAG: transposase [Candidatus Megaira endosymbiont of Mesostigma viride]|nr:hypothetical protein [Alphaproteobacteria bacterium]NDE18947.1 hypothetical protein [Alphaproteobacteria bacterium]UCM94708.1 MAG: transposase [Candidatus Megaira endosymbiont of Mesostigma viride]